MAPFVPTDYSDSVWVYTCNQRS